MGARMNDSYRYLKSIALTGGFNWPTKHLKNVLMSVLRRPVEATLLSHRYRNNQNNSAMLALVFSGN